ncbi:MAG TPA: 50S ribosomal protein L18e [Nanoarchaeota archaeon]|nr:50S ribosomal protein L18e [Nanoarchaeota archaeon]
MKPTGPTNPLLRKLIEDLRTRGYKEKIPFLIKIADELSRQRRRRVEVNVGKINRLCKENETIIVPGKVLGYGILTKPVTVAAWKFSKQAMEKIKSAGGKTLTIEELVAKNPKGSGVRIIC